MEDVYVILSLQDSFKQVDLVFATPTWILLAKKKVLIFHSGIKTCSK